MIDKTRKLSIIVPVYNEDTNIEPFYDACRPVMDALHIDSELIFVDDGSTDRSFEIISALGSHDARVCCLRFSRNFGSHPAILAGLRFARGDSAVMISVDMQDPPELIPTLVERWESGFKVVWAVREGREDPVLKKLFALAFYKLFRAIGLKNYPETGMDFGLFDRCLLDHLKDMKELNYFIPGVILWLGFPQTTVPYHRRARLSGHSKWSMKKRIKNALDAIVSFSYFPIRFISYAGIFISFVSFAYAFFLIARRLLFGLGEIGWPSIMVALLFLGGVQLITLGILGEYIWRSAEQVRERPQYIIMETTGFEGTLTARTVAAARAALEGEQS
jgi:dolichol-phosphate mannosyltransferase